MREMRKNHRSHSENQRQAIEKTAGCGGSLTKLISASGFQFKGTGWYVTDYARKERIRTNPEKQKQLNESKETKDTPSNGNKEQQLRQNPRRKSRKERHSLQIERQEK